ncbi:MIP18 protein, partial [Aegotheles bennettii]|nr:MIP18 protein [Aegotheles bennettii]
LIRSINDPEHPLTLEELNVVEQVRVKVRSPRPCVAPNVLLTCPFFLSVMLVKLDVHITPGTHASEHAVNKQLADKERVAAALENSHLLEVVNQCLARS